MLYQPNFCCHCGDKIERAEWRLTDSRRFCEICGTDHIFLDWLPVAFSGLMAIVGLFGIGTYIGAVAREPLPVPRKSVRPAVATSPAGNSAGKREPAAAEPRRTANATVTNRQTTEERDESAEICGALTKKGTACTRRVKGGGRCWQHRDQAVGTDNSARLGTR